MIKAVFVLALLGVCIGQLSAFKMHKRQVPPQPAPLNFQTEWFRIMSLLLQTSQQVAQCRATLMFGVANPSFDLPSSDTTPAPADPQAPTPSVPQAGAAKRQVPGQQMPLQFWQVQEINRLLQRYDSEFFQLQQCQYQLQFQQGNTGGGGVVNPPLGQS